MLRRGGRSIRARSSIGRGLRALASAFGRRRRRFRGGGALGLGDSGDGVLALQAQLRAYGYGVDATAAFDEHTHFVVAAFQRHFRPALVDGRADRSTLDTLDALLAALAEA